MCSNSRDSHNTAHKILALIGILLGLILAFGCGKPDLLDPPSKNSPPTAGTPRVAKPTTNSVYDNESNTAFICAIVTKNGTPFYKPDHYVIFSRAISGANRKFSGPFGVLEQSGKALVKIVSGVENISGYYRARLIHIDDDSKETVIAEWANIPINRKNSLVLELPTGEMARLLSEPWGNPVEMVYPNSRTVLEGGSKWHEALITLPKDVRGKYVSVGYYLLDKFDIDFSIGSWGIIVPIEHPDIFAIKFYVPWYAALGPTRLKLEVSPNSGKKYVVVSKEFSVELKRP
ncbi:MAG: hypothetical protein Q8R29_02515 [bacterium]|nr:hypothetical protein [bacterium]